MVGISAIVLPELAELSQCSSGLCLRDCSIGQRDLQRHDSCKPRRNTGHLRMDVGNHSEPELHASNPTVPTAPPPATNITNISTRAQVLTGDNILDGGFIITGTESKDVLIRGIGPSLSSPGLSGVLADPTLELHLPDWLSL